MMKKLSAVCAVAFAALFVAAQDVSAVELGVPFGFGHNTTFGYNKGGDDHWGSDIGLRIHFSDMFALQPSVSINFEDDNTNMGINADLLFYLFESNDIRMYLGGNIGFNIAEDDNEELRFGGIFGLQHSVTNAIDIFGQMGIGIRPDPEMRLYTVNTQLGVIFYISR